MTRFGQTCIDESVNLLASIKIVQFFVRKIDVIFWYFERVIKFIIQENKGHRNIFAHSHIRRPLPLPVIWIFMFYLFTFRMVLSMILVRFHKNPVNLQDIVKFLEKCRRVLRSIRFRELVKIREHQKINKKINGESRLSESPRKKRNRKRHYNKMLDFDILEELMIRQHPESDVLTARSTREKSVEKLVSINDIIGRPKMTPDDSISIVSLSESDNTFESTICDISVEKSQHSKDTGEKFIIPPNCGDETTQLVSELNNSQNKSSQEIVNNGSDPTDDLIIKLVPLCRMDKFNKKIDTKLQQGMKLIHEINAKFSNKAFKKN